MESEQLSHFERLAQKVENLLAKYRELSETNKRLESLLREKEEEINSLRQAGLAREQERVQVRDKVDNIIARIDRFLGESPGD